MLLPTCRDVDERSLYPPIVATSDVRGPSGGQTSIAPIRHFRFLTLGFCTRQKQQLKVVLCFCCAFTPPHLPPQPVHLPPDVSLAAQTHQLPHSSTCFAPAQASTFSRTQKAPSSFGESTRRALCRSDQQTTSRHPFRFDSPPRWHQPRRYSSAQAGTPS